MPRGQIVRYYSKSEAIRYFKVSLIVDGKEQLSYIEFEDGRTGISADTLPDNLIGNELWYSRDGIPKALVMEFFLMCFEAQTPTKRGTINGVTHEW